VSKKAKRYFIFAGIIVGVIALYVVFGGSGSYKIFRKWMSKKDDALAVKEKDLRKKIKNLSDMEGKVRDRVVVKEKAFQKTMEELAEVKKNRKGLENAGKNMSLSDIADALSR
jgi:succinate dehydrogenase/fumarate reductase flavoprotein subunit